MPNLLLFLSPGNGLNTWKNIGSLDRELKPYRAYVQQGWKVRILTFDRSKIPALPSGIQAVRFPHPRLLFLLPWLYWSLGKWANVIKTNQSGNVRWYIKAAAIWKKPIILRSGFVYGEFLENCIGTTQDIISYQKQEKSAFTHAVHCFITTKELKQWVQNKYGISEEKLSVIPNFIDNERFKPLKQIQKIPNSVIAVGRLAPVKQYHLLIEACSRIPGCALTIVGQGKQKEELTRLAEKHRCNLTLTGMVRNSELPHILQKHSVYAITSKCEGHPKSLIEAMACGMPCLTVNVKGIRNIITHNLNALLVEDSVDDMQKGLVILLKDSNLRKRLGEEAANNAFDQYNFDQIMKKEIETMNSFI